MSDIHHSPVVFRLLDFASLGFLQNNHQIWRIIYYAVSPFECLLLVVVFFFLFQFAVTQLIYLQTELQTQLVFLNLPIYISVNLLSYQGLFVFLFFVFFFFLQCFVFVSVFEH